MFFSSVSDLFCFPPAVRLWPPWFCGRLSSVSTLKPKAHSYLRANERRFVSNFFKDMMKIARKEMNMHCLVCCIFLKCVSVHFMCCTNTREHIFLLVLQMKWLCKRVVFGKSLCNIYHFCPNKVVDYRKDKNKPFAWVHWMKDKKQHKCNFFVWWFTLIDSAEPSLPALFDSARVNEEVCKQHKGEPSIPHLLPSLVVVSRTFLNSESLYVELWSGLCYNLLKSTFFWSSTLCLFLQSAL